MCSPGGCDGYRKLPLGGSGGGGDEEICICIFFWAVVAVGKPCEYIIQLYNEENLIRFQ